MTMLAWGLLILGGVLVTLAKLRGRRTPKPVVHTSGPWKGSRLVSRGPGVDAEKYAYYTANAVLDESGGFITRPGTKRIYSVALGGTPQLMYNFRKKDGTVLLVAISGGQIYTYVAGVYSVVVSTANFATASVTRSTTARMYAVTMTDKMVIHDGTNKPFTWDGTAGAGGLAVLSNADVWYGQHTVYYAKVFAIKNTDRVTFEWSEENDPTTGYEAGGFSNSWTMVQTSSEPLVGLLGTNEALYYWRTKGMGAIRGAAGPDFSTTGTQDAYSSTIGLSVSHARAEVNGAIWFVDQEGKLWRLHGGVLDPLWEQIADLYQPAGTGSGGSAAFGSGWTPSFTAITPLHAHGVVLISLAIGGNGNAAEHFVFQEDGNFVSDWIMGGYTITGVWFDVVTQTDFIVMTTSTGFTFSIGLPGFYWDENDSGTASAITLTVATHRLGWTEQVEQQFTRLDAAFNLTASPTTVAVQPSVETSRQAIATLGSQTTAVSGGVTERHLVWGLNRDGRWIAVTVPMTPSATTSAHPYGLRQIQVTGIPVSSTPFLT